MAKLLPGIYYKGKDKHGQNIYQIHIYHAELGKTKTHVVHGTVIDANNQKTLLEAEKIRGISPINAPTTTVKKLLLDWYDHYVRVKPRKRRTREENLRIINHDLIPRFGQLTLPQFKALAIEKYYDDLVDAGKSPNTIRRKHTIMNMAMEYAFKHDLVSVNICAKVDLPENTKNEAPYLNRHECGQVLNLMRDDVLYYPIAYTLAFTGMRLNECLGLSWAHLTFRKGLPANINIERSLTKYRNEDGTGVFDTPKSIMSKRPNVITQKLDLILRKHREWQEAIFKDDLKLPWDENTLVFCKLNGLPHAEGNVPKRIKKYMRKIGRGECHTHTLRHTHISLRRLDGQSESFIERYVGHADHVDSYDHVYEEEAIEMNKRFDALMEGIC